MSSLYERRGFATRSQFPTPDTYLFCLMNFVTRNFRLTYSINALSKRGVGLKSSNFKTFFLVSFFIFRLLAINCISCGGKALFYFLTPGR